MKAISLWQPWASLIRNSSKTFETRSWKTNHRGELLICSAKAGLSKKDLAIYIEKFGLESQELLFGKALCVVDLVDVIPTENLKYAHYFTEENYGDFSSGRFAWMLRKMRPIVPFDVIGRQGLFNVDDSLIKYIDGEKS